MGIKITGVVRNPEPAVTEQARTSSRSDFERKFAPTPEEVAADVKKKFGGGGGGGGGSGAVAPSITLTSGGVTIDGQGFSVRPEDIASFVAGRGGSLSQAQQQIIQSRLASQQEAQLVQKAKESGTRALSRSELIALGRGATQPRKGREEQIIKQRPGESTAAYEGRLLSYGKGLKESSPYTAKGYVEEEKKRLSVAEFEKKLKEPLGFTPIPTRKEIVQDFWSGERGKNLIGVGIPGTPLFMRAEKIKDLVIKGSEQFGKIIEPLSPQRLIYREKKPRLSVKQVTSISGKVIGELIPTTPKETVLTGGVIYLTGGAGMIGKVSRGVLSIAGGIGVIDAKQPIEKRIASGLVVVSPISGARNFFFRKKIVEIPAPTRFIREPEFIQISRPLTYKEEVINIGKYKMISDVKNPTLKYTTTAFREKFGLGPIGQKAEIIYSAKRIGETPNLVIGEKPFFFQTKIQGRKPITVDVITGTQQPSTIKDYRGLPKIRQFLWERLGEKISGRPMSSTVTKILTAERNVVLSDVSSIRVGKVTWKSPTKVRIKTPQPGKTTTSAISISELTPIIETDLLRVSKGPLIFKDVTKPFARATGKTPSVKQTIIEIKEPIDLGGTDVVFQQTGNVQKTSLQKTFSLQEQKIKMAIIKSFPKARPAKAKVILEPTKPTSVMVELPLMVGGAGLTEVQITRYAGKRLPGITQPVMEEDSSYTFDRTPKSQNLLSAKENIMTGNVNRIRIRDLQIGKLSVMQGEEFKIQPKEIFKSMLQPKDISKEIQKPREIQKEISKLAQKEMLKTQLKLKQSLKTTQIQIQTPKTKTTLKTPRTFITPTPEGKSPLDIALGKLKGKSVDILVGMKREKMEILERRLPPYLALKKASQYVEANIEASFKLVPSKKAPLKKEIGRFQLGKQFRPSKREPLYVVEKTQYRLNMPREKLQIKVARRGKRIKRRRIKLL